MTDSNLIHSPTPVDLKITMPDNQQIKISLMSTDTVWVVKQKLFGNSMKILQDSQNYGLYDPPCNGRTGKFLEEERTLKDYPLVTSSQLLLKYKQRINFPAGINSMKLKKLNTPSNQRDFMELVSKCEVERIDRLLNKGFDPNFNNIGQETPLTMSAMLSKPRQMMKTLVGGGAFLDFRNKRGQTPLHVAVFKENMEAVRCLLDLGCSPNYKDGRNLTALFLCSCHNKNIQCLKMLLHERAEVDCKDSDGWTELHHATKEGKTDMMEQLIFYGADVNAVTKDGNSPLHISAKFNQEGSCRLLLVRGGDKMMKNATGMMPSDIASINKHNNIYTIINAFKATDVVPFTEMPTYNDKRRGNLSIATMKNIARSRSIPNINSLFSNPVDPSSTISISSLNNFQTNGYLPTTQPPNHRVSALELDWNQFNKDDKSLDKAVTFDGVEEYSFVLQKVGNATFGFTLKGTNDSGQAFQSTPQTPSRNFIAGVEVGKLADEAGMRDGDFLIEINSINVSEKPHSFCVDSIVKSGKILRIKVLRKSKTLRLKGVNETSSNCDDSINKDLQATLDNFDKILESSPASNHSLEVNTSTMSPNAASVGIQSIEAANQSTIDQSQGNQSHDDQSNSRIPVPPPLPPTETLGKNSHKSMTALSAILDSTDDSGLAGSNSRPGTVRSTVGGFPEAAHDAIMEAVKRRRELVENGNGNNLSETIENRISKTRKLCTSQNISQPSKFNDSSSLTNNKFQYGSQQVLATSEAKTLPKSFKKSPADLSKSGSLGDNLDGNVSKGAAEEVMQSKTLPKKTSDLLNNSSESSSNFATVAEMMRQNFIKKKQQNLNGSQVALNETSSIHSVGGIELVIPSEEKNQTKEIVAHLSVASEPQKLKGEDFETQEEMKLKKDKFNILIGEIKPVINFMPKSRPAPLPPKKPMISQQRDEHSALEHLETNQPFKEEPKTPNTSPSNGVSNNSANSSIPQSPVSFGDLANMVAEKAAQMHKESEEKGILLVSQPPVSGTTKRYIHTSETKKSFSKSNSDQTSSKISETNDHTSIRKVSTSTSSTTRQLFPMEGSSVGEISKMFASAAGSMNNSRQQPTNSLSPRSASQDRTFATKDFKLQPAGKVVVGANKTSYSSTSAINMAGNPTILNDNKNNFKEVLVIPPPKEFASDFESKLNGGSSYTFKITSEAANKNTVYTPPRSSITSSEQIPTSPDAMFPTLKKTNQSSSNTMVFKAKVTSNSQLKKT